MSAMNLQELIKCGESKNLEFKEKSRLILQVEIQEAALHRRISYADRRKEQ
jgi:hypothetical protein